ncbi:hypothetical protein REPUB_Repub09cG0163800 [Reevesia pubescens]
MDRKLLVLGIPWEVDTDGLREYMSKYGDLEDCIVVKERSMGRSRGFGYVTFASADDAKEEMRASVKKVTRIFVARIPLSVDESTFRSHFEECGSSFLARIFLDYIKYEFHRINSQKLTVGLALSLLLVQEDDFRPTGRMSQGGYGAYNAYISSATRYAALGAPTLYDHPGSMYGRGESSRGMGKKIFVGRLPQEATVDDLRHYFGRFGRILDIYVPKVR